MQLTSLLGHASELVRIIRKSAQPADTLTPLLRFWPVHVRNKSKMFHCRPVFSLVE
ncbi:MAG: hypothetical protein J5I53_00760 [Bradyrhizobiaceae bacterium]|nr:hypothetical protein [Bradyrhizobiaceae bacterium]